MLNVWVQDQGRKPVISQKFDRNLRCAMCVPVHRFAIVYRIEIYSSICAPPQLQTPYVHLGLKHVSSTEYLEIAVVVHAAVYAGPCGTRIQHPGSMRPSLMRRSVVLRIAGCKFIRTCILSGHGIGIASPKSTISRVLLNCLTISDVRDQEWLSFVLCCPSCSLFSNIRGSYLRNYK